ncbi:TRAP transporter, DctM subunit [Natronincola peptidivorans]|uniref:TRAP transporter, DctM subunit n=1 Tax=Natronincola peptidivorans TaxID=426128 RepID=A0A1I0G5A9_9FIRM|nr:TRAP transporter large permease [Natronincola peptidivorans]SET66102.1 TRAP transporter, DctM subunit [Natronincola peptidivorans]
MTSTSIAMLLLLGLFFGLLLIRVPVAFALAIPTFITAMYLDIPAMVITQQMVRGISSFSLLAIPFFIVSGEIMGQGGISSRLIKFADVIVGRMRGGLAMVNVVASMFFGGISGSAVADTSSIGPVLIPMMKEKGYDTDYAVNVTIASSVQGIIIPPSHNMIIYSVVAGGVSIGNLFLAGILPGVFLGIMLMVISYAIAVKRNYPKGEGYSIKEALTITRESILGLMTAVIIIVGVTTGWFTATESAAIAAIWAFFVTFFIYKEIKISRMKNILAKSLRTLAMVMALIATSSAFAWMMAYLRIPTIITETLLSISESKIFILLIINLILLLLGMIMDMAPLILIATPILLPVVTMAGMDPVQFGIVLMLNLGIGLITPPVGSVLFVGCSIGGISMERTMRSLMPFYITMIITLLALTFIPSLTLLIPRLFGV